MTDRTCEQVRAAFVKGDAPSAPGLEMHFSTCQRCRELLADDACLGRSLGGLPRPSGQGIEGLRSAVLGAASRERGPRAWLRSRKASTRVTLVLLATAMACAVALARGGRVDLSALPTLAFAASVALYFAAVWVGARELMAPPSSARGPGRQQVLALALGTVAALAPWLVEAGVPANHAVGAGSLWPGAASCFLYGSAVTATILGWLWLLDRRDRPSSATAVLTATSAGLIGNLGLHLHCPAHDALHIAVGHLSVLVAWTSLYALLHRTSPGNK